MEIVINKKSGVAISEIKAGECFMYEDELYIKISQEDNYDDNAVCLSSGTPAYIAKSDKVTRSNAKIIVED